jgi:hypothetical protein
MDTALQLVDMKCSNVIIHGCSSMVDQKLGVALAGEISTPIRIWSPPKMSGGICVNSNYLRRRE